MAPQKSSTSWDPLLLISQASSVAISAELMLTTPQIVSMQSLHYLTLSFIVPPLLMIFADPASLEYEGGAANIGTPDMLSRHADDWLTLCGRYDYGLEGDGRTAYCAHVRFLDELPLGLEWREESRLRI